MSPPSDLKLHAEDRKSRRWRTHIKDFALRRKSKDKTNIVTPSSDPGTSSSTSIAQSGGVAVQSQTDEPASSAYVYKPPFVEGKFSAEALWEQAYEIVKSRNKALIEDYGRQLELDGGSHGEFGPGQLQAVLKSRIEKREAKRWMLQLGSHSLKVKEQYENVIRFVLWSDNIISGAVGSQPYLALAWSGVSMILPVSCYSPGIFENGH